jgi:hypothetical protein
MKVIMSLALVASAAAELTVHKSEPSHIHAEYNGLAVEVKHSGEDSAISRIYDAETGENFLQVASDEEGTQVQYFDHPVEEAGDHESYAEEWASHPKLALLGELSQQLGEEQGMNSESHPAAHWVHAIALSDAKSAETRSLLSTREEEGEEEEEEMWGGRRRRRRRAKWVTVPGGSSSGGNLVKRCENNCFGRCGPGCTCWQWICNDHACTQSHRGCWEHDCHCSCDGMANGKCVKVKASHHTCNWFKCADKYCAGTHLDEQECNSYGSPTGNWNNAGNRRRRRRRFFG